MIQKEVLKSGSNHLLALLSRSGITSVASRGRILNATTKDLPSRLFPQLRSAPCLPCVPPIIIILHSPPSTAAIVHSLDKHPWTCLHTWHGKAPISDLQRRKDSDQRLDIKTENSEEKEVTLYKDFSPREANRRSWERRRRNSQK